MEQNPNFICVKLDFRNAFNEVSRARVVEALEEEDALRYLALHAATLLAPNSGLETQGYLWGEAHEGTTQGDPESGPYFNVAIHKYVRIADSELAKVGGISRFGWDDLAQMCMNTVGLYILQRTKTEVLCMDTDLPKNAPDGLIQAGATINGKWEPGFICYGVPIGSDKYVLHMLNLKMEEIEREAEQVLTVLEEEKQALWTTLRSSLSHKLAGLLCATPHTQKKWQKEWILCKTVSWKVWSDSTSPSIQQIMDGQYLYLCQKTHYGGAAFNILNISIKNTFFS